MPAIQEITKIKLTPPTIFVMDNGIKVYQVNTGIHEASKIEIHFATGRPDEHKRLVAKSTVRLLKDGTKNYNSLELAEKIDFYGASLSLNAQLDASSIVLTSLNKHLDQLVPILAEIIWEPTFPQKEIDVFIKNNQEVLKLELTKNDVIAYRKFTELIFGEDHPYGYNSYPETYDAISRADLVQHHQERFGTNNCTIFISGKFGDAELQLLNEYLGKKTKLVAQQSANNSSVSQAEPTKAFFGTADTVQTSIKIGLPCFNRQHPDYYAMFTLNTIIGGYFGSRLMVNIREDKGYTYNIYSTLDTMKYNGYFYISTDTSHDLVEKTKVEIYKELKKLQDEPILEEEHKMVKNYLLGNFLTMIDGPYNTADVIKTFVTEELNIDHFNQLIQYILNFKPIDMQETAKKYLNPDQMWEITVGRN